MDTPAFLSSDAGLVRHALSGREGAFEALVWRYQRRAFAVAHAVGVEPANLEDVVQDSFLQAARSLSALRDPGVFGSWFLAIVRNLARKELRRSGFPRAASAVELDALPSPEPPAPDAHALRAELEREVGRLPGTLREAILLYYYEGRSTRRVARTLGITPSAARSRLKRGRDLLQDRLWRNLGDSIRERFPSTRTWRRTAGRLALLAVVSPGASSSARAMAGSGAVLVPGRMAASWIGGLVTLAKSSVFLWSAMALAMFILIVLAVFPPFPMGGSAPQGPPPSEVAASRPEKIAPPPPLETSAAGRSPPAPRGEPQPIQPPPDPGLSVSGTVIDRGTGWPVPGARVRLLPALREGSRPEEPHDEVHVGEDGTFLVAGAKPGGQATLEVTAENHARLYHFVQFPTGEPVDGVVLALEPGYVVHGNVRAALDLAGETEVSVACMREPWTGASAPLGIPPAESSYSRNAAIAFRDQVFRFANLPAGKYLFNATVRDPRFSRDNWAEVVVGEDHPSPEVEIVLEEGRTIRGRAVLDDGRPMKWALVTAAAASVWAAGASVDAGDDGAFEIAGLRQDLVYTLEIRWAAGDRQTFPLRADEDTYVVEAKEKLRILVRHGSRVLGLKKDEVFVSWNAFDAPGSPAARHHIGKEAGGTVPRGNFRKAFVWCEGMGFRFAPVVIDLTETTGPDLYIEVEEGAVLEGRVVTGDGNALHGVEVRVAANLLGPETRRRIGEHCIAKARTGENGEFVIRGLPVDPKLVSVSVSDTGGWVPAAPLEVTSYGAPVTFVMTK